MSGKARVHDLAREFGVDSRTILAMLKEDGHFVKSASSTVEAPVARRLRDRLQQGHRPSPSAQVRQRPTPARRNVDQDPLDLAALLFDRDRRSLRPAPKPRPPRAPIPNEPPPTSQAKCAWCAPSSMSFCTI